MKNYLLKEELNRCYDAEHNFTVEISADAGIRADGFCSPEIPNSSLESIS